MKTSHFKLIIGLLIVLSWFFALGFSMYLAVARLLPFDTALQTILILSPVFSVYVTLVIRDAIANRLRKREDETLSIHFVVYVTLFTSFFSIAIFSLLIIYYQGDISKDQLQQGLAAVETCLGFCLGLMIHALFPEGNAKKEQTNEQSISRA